MDTDVPATVVVIRAWRDGDNARCRVLGIHERVPPEGAVFASIDCALDFVRQTIIAAIGGGDGADTTRRRDLP